MAAYRELFRTDPKMTAKSYANFGRATAVICNKIEQLEIEGIQFSYQIAATKEGRFMPIVFGPADYFHYFVHAGFCYQVK